MFFSPTDTYRASGVICLCYDRVAYELSGNVLSAFIIISESDYILNNFYLDWQKQQREYARDYILHVIIQNSTASTD